LLRTASVKTFTSMAEYCADDQNRDVAKYGLCFAQASRDSKPASSNVLDAQFPQVDSNSRALIRSKAAECH